MNYVFLNSKFVLILIGILVGGYIGYDIGIKLNISNVSLIGAVIGGLFSLIVKN